MSLAKRLLSVQPSGGGFAPTDIAGCALWLDAADTATITTSATNLTGWTDKSGNGFDCIISATNSDVTGTSTLNGLNAMDLWVGSPSGTIFAPITSVGGLTTIFIVHEDGAPGQGSAQLFDFRSTSSGTPLHDDAALRGLSARTRNDSDQIASASVMSSSGPTVYVYRSDAAHVQAWANRSTATGRSSRSGSLTGLDRFSIGRNGVSNEYRYIGVVGEAVVYDNALSAGDRNDVEDYLAAKWGITL